jgi:hypothetical protein
LGSPCTLTGSAEATVNEEVPPCVASFIASATFIPLDKLYPKQRRAQEQEHRDQKGTLQLIGIGSALVRFANRALFAAIGDEVSQWLAARHQFGVGVRGGVEIVKFIVQAALDPSPDWMDLQGDAFNAFNEFLRRPLFEELCANPVLRPLLRVATMLYGRPSTLHVYDSSNAHGPVMRIPSTREIHQGCMLGAMFFAIIASRVYKQLASIAPNESVVCGYYDDGHFLGCLASLVAIGDAMPEAYASVGITVTIRKTCLYSPSGVGDAFDNLPNGHIMRGVHVSTEGTKILGGTIGTSDFAGDVFETALSKYEAYGERLRGLAAHRHSYPSLRIHQNFNSRFEHFARTVPRGLGSSEGYGDTVVTFLERADNATLDVAAEILGLPAAGPPRNTRSDISLPIRFGGMGVGDLVALADSAHVGAACLAVGFAIRFLKARDARVRGDSNDELPIVATMYGRLATTMTTAVSRRHGSPDGDDGDNEPMWSLELASSWARLDAACGSHVLAETEPLISTALAMLPPLRLTVARAGCVAETRTNNEQIARSRDGLPSLVPLSAFATDIFPRLQDDINERVNLLRFAKLAPTFSNRARPESRRFAYRLGHGTLAFLASDPPTSGRLGELRDKFPKHYDTVFRVAGRRIFGLPSSRILSTLRSPTACASCHLSVQAMRATFASAGVDMSDDAWATAFADHLARYGGDAYVHTAHSWLVTALAEIISEARGALGVGVEVLTDPTMLVHLPNGNDGLPADVDVLHYHGIRGSKLALDAMVSGMFGVSRPPSPEVPLRCEKTEFEKYLEGVRSRPDIRFIPFAVTEFGALGGHATAFLTELAKQAAASEGMHVGKLSASWRRKVSLAVHVAHADNALRGFSARRTWCGGRSFLGWEAFSCHGALHPRHGPQASPCFLERRVGRRLSPPRVAFSALPRFFFSLVC